jgi:beta-phosphoglucomutase-like phosphatase (HAD superfamily)
MEDQDKAIPQGIFFDMDGTLLLTTQSAEESWLHVFQHFEPLHHYSPEQLGRLMHDVYRSYKTDYRRR